MRRKDRDATKKAMRPGIRPKLEAQGVQFGGAATPAEFSAFIRTELVKIPSWWAS